MKWSRRWKTNINSVTPQITTKRVIHIWTPQNNRHELDQWPTPQCANKKQLASRKWRCLSDQNILNTLWAMLASHTWKESQKLSKNNYNDTHLNWRSLFAHHVKWHKFSPTWRTSWKTNNNRTSSMAFHVPIAIGHILVKHLDVSDGGRDSMWRMWLT